MKSHLKLVAPTTDLRTVGTKPTPKRQPNTNYRTREHLTENEVDGLIAALRKNRYGQRDALMALVAYRHGLRVSELIDLRWDDVDWTKATLYVRRLKGSDKATHPILSDELRALRKLQREQEPKSAFVFVSERGAPFTRAGFALHLPERRGWMRLGHCRTATQVVFIRRRKWMVIRMRPAPQLECYTPCFRAVLHR